MNRLSLITLAKPLATLALLLITCDKPQAACTKATIIPAGSPVIIMPWFGPPVPKQARAIFC